MFFFFIIAVLYIYIHIQSDSNRGGSESSEFCSYRDTAYVCWDQRLVGLPSPYENTIFALNSRCVDTVTETGFEHGYCFQHECYGYNTTTKTWTGVFIKLSSTETIDCDRNEKSMTIYSDELGFTMTCPDIDSICRNTQPFACYFGNYNDDLGRCICSPGFKGDICDTYDTDFVDGVVLGSYTTPSPTVGEDYLCMQNVPTSLPTLRTQWNGDEWIYDGVYNYYPSYVFDGYYYLYWNLWYHRWYIAASKGRLFILKLSSYIYRLSVILHVC